MFLLDQNNTTNCIAIERKAMILFSSIPFVEVCLFLFVSERPQTLVSWPSVLCVLLQVLDIFLIVVLSHFPIPCFPFVTAPPPSRGRSPLSLAWASTAWWRMRHQLSRPGTSLPEGNHESEIIVIHINCIYFIKITLKIKTAENFENTFLFSSKYS